MTIIKSSGRVVVKLLACGARGPGFDSRSRHYDFRDLFSPVQDTIWLKDRWSWEITKATSILKRTNHPTYNSTDFNDVDDFSHSCLIYWIYLSKLVEYGWYFVVLEVVFIQFLVSHPLWSYLSQKLHTLHNVVILMLLWLFVRVYRWKKL